MEKLFDHTLRRQLAEQGAQITKLTALVEMLAAGGAPPPANCADDPQRPRDE